METKNRSHLMQTSSKNTFKVKWCVVNKLEWIFKILGGYFPVSNLVVTFNPVMYFCFQKTLTEKTITYFQKRKLLEDYEQATSENRK